MDNITKITIAFCEGPHDTAFLYRILKTKCFQTFKDTLADLPNIVGDFIISKNKSTLYEQLKIDSLRNEFVPYRIMYKNENLILLHSLGGDKDHNDDDYNKRLIILKHFFENIKENVTDPNNHGSAFVDESSPNTPFEYSFLFFYDADEDKNEKLTIVNKYMEKMKIAETLEHNEVKQKPGYSIGTYIFSNTNDKGALEDILFELMKKDNEVIFNQATDYYTRYLNKDNNMNNECRTKRLVTECDGNGGVVDRRKDSKQEDAKKSIICIAGQLQKKGKANTVIIEDSDYLNLQKIQNSTQLQEIISFFEK